MDYSDWFILFCAGSLWTVGVLFLTGITKSWASKTFSLVCFISSILSFTMLGVYTADSPERAFNIHYINSIWGFLLMGYIFLFSGVVGETKILPRRIYQGMAILLASLVFVIELFFKNAIHEVITLENGYSIQIQSHLANDIVSLLNVGLVILLIIEFYLILRNKNTPDRRKKLVGSILLICIVSIVLGIPIFSAWFFSIPIQMALPLFYLITLGMFGSVIYSNQWLEPNSLLVTKNILENTTNFLIILDNEGNIKEVNNKIGELSFISPEDYINENITKLIPELNYALKNLSNDKFYSTDYFLKQHEEYLIPVELFISSIDDKNIRIGYLIMGNDLTNHIKVQEKLKNYAGILEEHTKRLERSNEDLKNFANVLSHDLRSPLNTISGFTGILERKNKDNLVEGSQEYIDFIKKGCENMSNIIDSLLQVAKYGSNQLMIEELQLQEILEDTLVNLQGDILSSNTSVILGHLHTIHADRIQMLQLFQNLIQNAIKYSKKDVAPVINISSQPNQVGTFILIKDNGIGISKENQEKIFNIFNQIDNTTDGIGLGLATCKKIVENHHGEIDVDSQEGEGCIFKIFIPYKKYNPAI